MLLAILYIYQNTASTDFLYLSLSDINIEYQKILWLAFFISFAIKTPLFPFHIWLFRAHAEAPLAGSIILAAVILKLASYGFLRVLIPFFPDACLYFLPLVQTIASITIVYASLSTLRQIDNKQLVAMSSVAHINPNGPLNIFYLLSQTICGKPNDLNPFYLGTNNISYYFNKEIQLKNSSILVKILNNYLGNPQITKTCLNIYKIFNLLKIKLFIMLVGISETTRLLFTNIIILFKSTFFNFYFNLCLALATRQGKGYKIYRRRSFSNSNLIQTTSDCNSNSEDKESNKHFYEWLAGLIDGDGYF